MSDTQSMNIEELFTQLISWENNKKELIHWIFSLAVQLNDENFFHRAKVLQYCDERDFEALKTITDSSSFNMSFIDVQVFLHSISFTKWLEGMKNINGDEMFIFSITFLFSFNADIDGKITTNKFFNTLLSFNPEQKILFLTLSAILRREHLKK